MNVKCLFLSIRINNIIFYSFVTLFFTKLNYFLQIKIRMAKNKK